MCERDGESMGVRVVCDVVKFFVFLILFIIGIIIH